MVGSFPEAVRGSLRRPFFALLAGLWLRERSSAPRALSGSVAVASLLGRALEAPREREQARAEPPRFRCLEVEGSELIGPVSSAAVVPAIPTPTPAGREGRQEARRALPARALR